MVKYVENKFDEDYIQTLGVNFMEKSIILRDTEITFSIWDLGGQKEFLSMLPLVCNDAIALFFMFDLTRKSTLLSIKEWYRQARLLNRVSCSTFFLSFFLDFLDCLIFGCDVIDCTGLPRGYEVRHLLCAAPRRDRRGR